MAWIEFHQPLVTHRKLYALAAALKVRRAVAAGHLAFLWCWALDNAPTGDLTGIDPEVIRLAADWPKNATAFVAALTSAGFIDEQHDTRTLHDWGDYAGKLLDRRERNRDAMRRARADHVSPRVKLPNSTQPNPTVDNRAAAAGDPVFARIIVAYENLAGSVTKTVSEEIGELYDAGVSEEWFLEAFAESERANVRKWKYAKSIVERYQREGFSNGTKPVRRNPATGVQSADGTDSERW